MLSHRAARGLTIDVDLGAIVRNYQTAKAQSGGRAFAVLKADAYGHGAVPVAQALAAIADGVATVSIDEAVELREAGIEGPVLVLQGPRDAQDIHACRTCALWPVLHDADQIERVLAHPDRSSLDAWLELDTGMGRLGLRPDEAEALFARGPTLRWRGVMSHFACADEPGNAHTREQIATFDRLIDVARRAHARDHGDAPIPETSLANSAGLLAWPESRRDWSRPGLMLYGLDPLVAPADEPTPLAPAMRASAPLISVKSLPRGAGIGYGQTYRCPEPMTVGYVAAGYGDGLPRVLDETASVHVDGMSCPVIGRVSMDSIAIDLRPAATVSVGDRVVLFGPEHPAERLASAAGTITYEIVTAMRGDRQYHAGTQNAEM